MDNKEKEKNGLAKEEKDNKEGMSGNISNDMQYLNSVLSVNDNYDIVYRVVEIGGRMACMYLVDGFCKDDLMQKLLQKFMEIKEDEMPKDAHAMSKKFVSYVEVDIQDKWDMIINSLLSGVFVLLVDGYTKAILIDSRTYPARNVDEPDKDKVLRG